jgi:hypothetical protein
VRLTFSPHARQQMAERDIDDEMVPLPSRSLMSNTRVIAIAPWRNVDSPAGS